MTSKNSKFEEIKNRKIHNVKTLHIKCSSAINTVSDGSRCSKFLANGALYRKAFSNAAKTSPVFFYRDLHITQNALQVTAINN